jgi:diguanylate cyclase (GGDEF)-like protein
MYTSRHFLHRKVEAPLTRPAVPPRRVDSQRLAGVVTAIAALAALAVALAFPAAYFLSAHNRQVGVLEVGAEIYADRVMEEASQSPDLWNALLGDSRIDLSGLPIAAAGDSAGNAGPPERRRVFAADGHLLWEVPAAQPLRWPVVAWQAAVLQNGHRLGGVEITRSLRPQVLATLAVAGCSFAFGLLLLTVLRVVPLRLMREALDRASFLSAHDQLTGLPNRALLADRLEQALSAAKRGGTLVAMLCLDLDRFKDVNDTLGHSAGDTLLRIVTERLRRCLRESDTVARLGGDEFAIVLPSVRSPRDAEGLAARLIEVVREPVDLDGQQVFIGVSIGIAFSTPDADGAELAKQADVALYQAKSSGRGGFCFFAPEMNASVRERRAIENDLRAALARDELTVCYQPQIDLATGRIDGAEALMRWSRPGHGQVPPSLFIPIAEETGLIGAMGAWLLREACRDAAQWPEAMHVAVNVSPVQFRLAGFREMVRGALAQSGLDPCRLELEVTEGILLNDTEETLATLADLRALGVRLAMDDFGTGYASLGYLQKFRFDKIKIDRSFVQTLGADPNAAAIVSAVVGLSDALGMATNAEGVETQEQAAMLRARGCREVQGFLYWKPMPAQAMMALIETQRATA